MKLIIVILLLTGGLRSFFAEETKTDDLVGVG
jgi:hypothetical protein